MPPAPHLRQTRAPFINLLSHLDFITPRCAYIVRSIAAAGLALAVAYQLELDMPYSAASTVLLVINPTQGAVIGKGSWRLIGTLIGILAALLLMSLFGQMPLLFIIAFGCWMGLCVAAMTLLRHFKGSGAVVAGYTVGLATYGAMGHPEKTFEHVIGRGSTVAIGVVCLGLVVSLFSARGMREKLAAHYARLAANTAKIIGDSTPAAEPARVHIMSDIYSIDDLLALGKAESKELAQRAAAIRDAMSSLFSALAGGPTPQDCPPEALKALSSPLQAAWLSAGDALAEGADGARRAVTILQAARAHLIEQRDALNLPNMREEAALLIAADRQLEQVDDYLAALVGLSAIDRPRAPLKKRRTVHFHRPLASAAQNGFRAMLTLVLAGFFWLENGWNYGDMMLLVLAPYCALVATMGNPAAGAWQFLKGTMYAVPAAFVCAFGILPHLDGLPLLVITLALFWLPGIYATTLPRHMLAGLAYLVGFNTLAAADNPMHYNLHDFLNYSVAWIAATAFAVLSFQLLLPRNPERDIERLRHRVRNETLALLRGKSPDAVVWQQRQQHRIAQLGAMLKSSPQRIAAELAPALAAIHVGREVLRIKKTLASRRLPPTPHTVAQRGMVRLAATAGSSSRTIRHARRTARQLAGMAERYPQQRQDIQKTMAAFADIFWLIQRHAHYFNALPAQERLHE
ncbi:FUSC family protein [Serratia marcescens]|nr:FUSC family protein [Serratia marcescens]